MDSAYQDHRISRTLLVNLVWMSSIPRLAVIVMPVVQERGMRRVFPPSKEYTDISRFVEYETSDDLASAVEKLDGSDFKGAVVRCISDVRFYDHSTLRLRH